MSQKFSFSTAIFSSSFFSPFFHLLVRPPLSISTLQRAKLFESEDTKEVDVSLFMRVLRADFGADAAYLKVQTIKSS